MNRNLIYASFIVIFCSLLSFTLLAAESKSPPKSKIPGVSDKLPTFNAVEIEGVGDLYIVQSTGEEGVTVEAEDEILPLIKLSVKDKTLFLGLKDAEKHTKAKIKYHVTMKDIRSVRSSSTSSVFVTEGMKTDTFRLVMDGFGEAEIKITANKFITKIYGGASVRASGSVSDQDILISGAGEFNGISMLGKEATVTVSGSGIAKLNVSDRLGLTASGDGIVKYCGQPTIEKQLSDNGIVLSLLPADCK